MLIRSLWAPLCLCAPALLAGTTAQADQLPLTAVDDAAAGLFDGGEPSFADGQTQILVTGTSTAVIEFSLATLPEQAVITAASLQVYVQILGTVGGAEGPPDVPIAEALFGPGNGNAEYADLAGTGFHASGDVTVASGLLSIPLGAADLQAILDGGADYLTVNLRRAESAHPGTWFGITALEGASSAFTPPQLVLTYEIPEPAAAAFLGLGGVALLRRRHAHA